MRKRYLRRVAWYLAVAMIVSGWAPTVEAGMAPSEIIYGASVRADDINRIEKTIESKMVRDRLEKLGFTADEIKARLGRLSDRQLHKLALNLDNIKVAGDGLGAVIAVLIIAILVVLLLQLTGHRVIVR